MHKGKKNYTFALEYKVQKYKITSMQKKLRGKKYNFNHDTLTFEQIEVGTKDRLVGFVLYIIFALVVASLTMIVSFSFFKSPQHKLVEKDNQELRKQFDQFERRLSSYVQELEYLENRDNEIYREMFGAPPVDSYVRQGGRGGRELYNEYVQLDHGGIIRACASKLDQIKRRLYVQTKSYDTIQTFIRNKEDYIAHLPAIQPIANKTLSRIASGFGLRVHPIYGVVKAHTGMDFAAPIGTAVYSTGDGVVEKIEDRAGGYGRNIVVNHGYGYKTLYAHLSKFNVKMGQKVKRGETIGFIGNTGTSTSPHLHYEVRKSDKPQNPARYFFNDLTDEEYEEMLRISDNAKVSFD